MAFKSVSSRLPHPPLIARCRAYDDAATHRMLLATLISRRRIGYADQSGGRLIQRSSCSSFSTSSTGFVGRRTRRTCDAIVIGSGVIGSACALELRKKGFTTLNVDANAAPGYGSTSSSSAVIRVFYSLPDSCAIAWEGYHAWKKWKDYLEAGPTEDLSVFHETGAACLDVPTSAMCQSYLGKVRAAMEQFKIPCEDWDAEYLQKRMPYMSLQSYYPPRRIDDERFGEENGNTITGAYFTKHAGYVNDPQLAARNLVHAAQRKGAEFEWRANVRRILKNDRGSRVIGVELADNTVVEAPIIVNCAGPHSSTLHRLAFESADVVDDSKVTSRPLKVEVAYVHEPPGSMLDQTLPTISDLDTGIYVRPQQGGQMLIGSVEPECDELEYLDRPEDLEPGLTEEWNNLVYRAGLRFPDLGLPNTAAGLTALYDVTPDWVPIYDRTALGGFYIMGGTSGNQFKNAPVAGQLLARLVDACENGHDHDANPVQLPLPLIGSSISSKTFSRLRSQEITSGTVLG